MAFTYGFYNSINYDRKYNALQMSSIFDGIIRDGVFSTIGDAFAVTPNSGFTVSIGTGRAWFNHTWSLNDSIFLLNVPPLQSIIQSRIDAIVIEVDASLSARQNSLKVVSGVESSNPVKPTLTHTDEVNQYALAYITITPETSEIQANNIKMVVGTNETPFVSGVLQQVSIETLLQNWNTEFMAWESARQVEFMEWFDNLQYVLDGDVAGHLQHEIDEINSKINSVLNDMQAVLDQYSENVLTSPILSLTIMPSNWVDAGYTLNDSRITTTSNQEWMLAPNATLAQVKAWGKAAIVDGGQQEGQAAIRARGAIPTIDLPVRVILRGVK